jgi:hypothetical protein
MVSGVRCPGALLDALYRHAREGRNRPDSTGDETGPRTPTRARCPVPGARCPGTPCSLSLVRARVEKYRPHRADRSQDLHDPLPRIPKALAISERDEAFEERNEEIVRVLTERPETTAVELIQRFHTSGQHLARLRAVARKRRLTASRFPGPLQAASGRWQHDAARALAHAREGENAVGLRPGVAGGGRPPAPEWFAVRRRRHDAARATTRARGGLWWWERSPLHISPTHAGGS